MNSVIHKIKNGGAVKFLKMLLSSKYFPFFTAYAMVMCYYLSLDIVAIYFLALTSALIFLLLDDVTPIISNLLFVNVFSSLKNTPLLLVNNSDYYFRPEILSQIIVVVGIMVICGGYRVVVCGLKKQINLTPMFFGIGLLCVTFLLGGAFYENYTNKNVVFALLLSATLLGMFFVISACINPTKESFEKIAYAFVALSVLLIIELAVIYATTENLFIDGKINRSVIKFGWGVYNTYAVWIVMCIPPVFYLAARKKFGYLLTAYSLLILVASVLCCSRQAMVGAAIIYPVCTVILLVTGKNKLANGAVFITAAVAACILAIIFREKVLSFFKEILANIVVDGELNGSGRWAIWNEAINLFKKRPVFGSGFFLSYGVWENEGNGIFPHRCHNTILQMLASCGIIGLAVYILHRVQTVICFFKNVNAERTFIALNVLVILILSLLDTQIFNILPTIIYACMLAILDKTSEKPKKLNT